MTATFRLVWIITNPAEYRRRFKVDPSEMRGVMLDGPLTHHEACTILRKQTPYTWRVVQLEPID